MKPYIMYNIMYSLLNFFKNNFLIIEPRMQIHRETHEIYGVSSEVHKVTNIRQMQSETTLPNIVTSNEDHNNNLVENGSSKCINFQIVDTIKFKTQFVNIR